jgi:hypothetical protein
VGSSGGTSAQGSETNLRSRFSSSLFDTRRSPTSALSAAPPQHGRESRSFPRFAIASRASPSQAGSTPTGSCNRLSGLIFAGLMMRNRLPFGIASNLSLIYSATLLYSSIVEYGTTSGIRMNLSGLATPAGVLAAMMLALSVWSTAISHRSYWRDIFAQPHANCENAASISGLSIFS